MVEGFGKQEVFMKPVHRMTRYLIATGLVALLAACSNSTILSDSSGIRATTKGSAALYSIDDMIETTTNSVKTICEGSLKTTSADSQDTVQSTTIATAQEALELVKNIFDWLPEHSYSWHGTCSGSGGGSSPSPKGETE